MTSPSSSDAEPPKCPVCGEDTLLVYEPWTEPTWFAQCEMCQESAEDTIEGLHCESCDQTWEKEDVEELEDETAQRNLAAILTCQHEWQYEFDFPHDGKSCKKCLVDGHILHKDILYDIHKREHPSLKKQKIQRLEKQVEQLKEDCDYWKKVAQQLQKEKALVPTTSSSSSSSTDKKRKAV